MKISNEAIKTVHDLRINQAGVLFLQSINKDVPYRHAASTHGEFVAWDGEGFTDSNGYHNYMLLQVSTGARLHSPRLSTIQCLDFILANAKPKTINVIYGGGYDASKWLQDISEEAQYQLKKTNKLRLRFLPPGKSPRTFDVEYIPHKWFQVTGQSTIFHPIITVKIFDVMTFFQQSFIAALNSRDIEVPEIITSGKASRNTFTYEDLEEISVYCGMELELLIRLCNQLRAEFREAGIPINSYHGPGAVANAVLRIHKIKEFRDAEPEPFFEDIIRYSYFGGRFEQFGAGHYADTVYLYDIRSAYPFQLTTLPNLRNARWIYSEEFTPGSIGVWFCRATSEDHRRAHAAPWRAKRGRVAFPAANDGVWLLTPEAKNAEQIDFGYVLITEDDRKPFDFIHEIYNKRQQWVLEGRGGEKALKLAMNSIYGKLCQAIGNDGKRPANHQMLWAALITSGTRAMIWDAISQAPNDIIAIETDSVLSKVPLDLDIGPGLGQWELKTMKDVTYIQSGVYFAEGGAAKNKTRGINPAKLNYSMVMDWLESGMSYPLLSEETRFIGISNWSRHRMLGLWETQERGLSLAGGKRIHAEYYCDACAKGKGYHEALHDLITVQEFGHAPSAPHKLPWLDGEYGNGEQLEYAGDVKREWENARH